ncbi:MAG: hypothetical protein QOH04_1525 [Sphingomonadales bacterium]|nr:hypothetical protein [Sphingomonadales bacterium]
MSARFGRGEKGRGLPGALPAKKGSGIAAGALFVGLGLFRQKLTDMRP